MSKDYLAGVLTGIVGVIILASLPSSNVSKYRDAIDECQKNLPRNVHCKVVGVVDAESKN